MNNRPKDVGGDPGPSAEPFAVVADIQRAGFWPLNSLGIAWLESLNDVGAEVADFMARRIRDDVETQHAVLHSTSPEELQHIQAQFVQRAMDQYADETGRMIELSHRIRDIVLAQPSSSSED